MKSAISAIWGYYVIFFPGHPKLELKVLNTRKDMLAAYWQQPGQSGVKMLRNIHFHERMFTEAVEVYHQKEDLKGKS